MERDYNFWIYIITNRTHTVLYIGMTNDLARRISDIVKELAPVFRPLFAVRS